MLEVTHMERDGDDLYYPSKAEFLEACKRPGDRVVMRIEGQKQVQNLIEVLDRQREEIEAMVRPSSIRLLGG